MLNTPLRDRDSNSSRFVRLFFGDLWLPLIVVTLSFLLAIATFSTSKVSVVKKEPLIASLTTAIGNGADLSVIRHIYKQRKQERSSLISALIVRTQDGFRSDDFYSADSPLSDILQDIRTNQFLGKTPNTSPVLVQLEKLIREHTQANPFDKLEAGQRETFENIRTKLGQNYDSAANDLGRISDELYSKNIAVEKYLRDSTFNLWLSIFALFMSLVISAYQIFQSREKRVRELFRQVIRESPAPQATQPEA